MHSPLESFTPLWLGVAPQRLHWDACLVTVGRSIGVFEKTPDRKNHRPLSGHLDDNPKLGAVSSSVAVSSTVRQA
jgi:hypothetical protein